MTRTIDFPHLGIHLSSVGNHITVFGFDIAYYGMIIGAGTVSYTHLDVYKRQDETREIRAEMSRMIRANLAGWGKEYEQI